MSDPLDTTNGCECVMTHKLLSFWNDTLRDPFPNITFEVLAYSSTFQVSNQNFIQLLRVRKSRFCMQLLLLKQFIVDLLKRSIFLLTPKSWGVHAFLAKRGWLCSDLISPLRLRKPKSHLSAMHSSAVASCCKARVGRDSQGKKRFKALNGLVASRSDLMLNDVLRMPKEMQ